MDREMVCLECPLPECKPNDHRCPLCDKMASEYGSLPGLEGGHRTGRCPTAEEIEIAFRESGMIGARKKLGINFYRLKAALVRIGLAVESASKRRKR